MRQGAVIILRRNDGAVLMQHRDSNPNIAYPGYWALPGGAAEEGEDPKNAALRELREETGYSTQEGDITFICTEPQIIKGVEILRSIYLISFDGVQGIQCREGKEMRFVDPHELSSMQVFEDHLRFIKKAEEMLFTGQKERKR